MTLHAESYGQACRAELRIWQQIDDVQDKQRWERQTYINTLNPFSPYYEVHPPILEPHSLPLSLHPSLRFAASNRIVSSFNIKAKLNWKKPYETPSTSNLRASGRIRIKTAIAMSQMSWNILHHEMIELISPNQEDLCLTARSMKIYLLGSLNSVMADISEAHE